MYDFVFPDNKTIKKDKLQQYLVLDGGYIEFTDIDIMIPAENLITIDSIEYYFTYLSDKGYNKGGNSIILKLYESQLFDIENIEYGNPDLILKILKFPHKKRLNKSSKRFLKEIDALKKCKENNFQNVINIFHDGICICKNPISGKMEEYLFYTMEYAEFDLKGYIEKSHNTLSYDEKITLCISLAEGLKELESLGYYHRDIKPDNIFMTAKHRWKIGDLGLIDDRALDDDIDDIAEAIGPRGWMSPESMNKHLCENKGFTYNHNCKIDHQSDIFQLGKVFWYIFQHNAPIGTVKESDFLIQNTQIFSIIKTMLNHSKKKRYKNIDEVIRLLKPLEVSLLKAIG